MSTVLLKGSQRVSGWYFKCGTCELQLQTRLRFKQVTSKKIVISHFTLRMRCIVCGHYYGFLLLLILQD